MNLGFSHHSLFPQAVCNFSCLNATVLLRATSELVTVRVGGAVGRSLGRRLLGGALGRLRWAAPLGVCAAPSPVVCIRALPAVLRPNWLAARFPRPRPVPHLSLTCRWVAAPPRTLFSWRTGPCEPCIDSCTLGSPNKCFLLLTGRLCYSGIALWIREGAAQVFGKLKWVTWTLSFRRLNPM